ncbi:MAG: 1-deoxy-D-xylulose-5-phosphate reductoisomerase [Verrucomicrobia bacterium]|nr:1-deoxy-D-xylulose-5-phosphate reductoisomerase [Verrucomicrobiota bacterium]
MEPRPIAILGASGSIGTTTLAVVRAHPGLLRVSGMASLSRWRELVAPAKEFGVRHIALGDPTAADEARASGAFDSSTTILSGPEGLTEIACMPAVRTVVSAVVGTAGLVPTLAALRSGKDVALASKELLVMAGRFITRAAAESGARLLPVDSEHNALHQLLRKRPQAEVSRLVLTASGGAFRDTPLERLGEVTPEQALRHPSWSMGPKVTVDSATMANKGLEIVEATWLFGLPQERIDVVIHPQSVIHAMVTLSDGGMEALLSPPSMAFPIQDCLLQPQRPPCPAPGLDLTKTHALTMSPPDPARYPCLGIARAAAAAGACAPAAFNAANEVAVGAFMASGLRFTGIAEVVRRTMERGWTAEPDSLEDALAADAEARRLAAGYAAKLTL